MWAYKVMPPFMCMITTLLPAQEAEVGLSTMPDAAA